MAAGKPPVRQGNGLARLIVLSPSLLMPATSAWRAKWKRISRARQSGSAFLLRRSLAAVAGSRKKTPPEGGGGRYRNSWVINQSGLQSPAAVVLLVLLDKSVGPTLSSAASAILTVFVRGVRTAI